MPHTPSALTALSLSMALSLALSAPALAQSSDGDKPPEPPTPTPQPTPQPPPPPPVFMPPKGGTGLGGVRMRLPSPHSGGSLLDRRTNPFPPPPTQPSPNPGPFPPDKNPKPPIIVVPVRTYPYVIPSGASISYDTDGRIIYHGPVIHSGLYYAPSGPYWKYPYSYYRSSYGSRGWYDATVPVYQPGTSDRFVQSGPQSRPATAPGEAATELDLAESALIAGDYQAAISAYDAQLKLVPSDAASQRMLGITLILDRQIAEGVEAIAEAYQKNPVLASTSFDSSLFPYIQTLRERAAAAISHAHRVQSWEAYLAAAVLKHAEGEKAVALKMLDKSAQLDLPDAIEQPLRTTLAAKR